MRQLVPICGVLLLSAAWAQEADRPQSAPPSVLVAVEAGWGGWVPEAEAAPAPVWATLRNPAGQPRELVVEASSGAVRARRAVRLPAGARRRVSLCLACDKPYVRVRVLAWGRVLAQREVSPLRRLEAERPHALCLEGDPASSVRFPEEEGDQPLLATAALRFAATEAAAYEAFGLVVLRGVGAGELPEEARAALVDYAARGGTVVVSPCSGRAPGSEAFARSLPGGPPRAEEVFGGGAERVRALGFGRLVLHEEDLLAGLSGSRGRDALRRQRFRRAAREGRQRLPLRWTPGWHRPGRDFAGPGAFTGALVAGFVLLYLFAIGPGLAVALRKSSRRRLALCAAGTILAFVLLALLVTAVVLAAPGSVAVREALYVPGDGPALRWAGVELRSGGGRRHSLRLGGGELSLTRAGVDFQCERRRGLADGARLEEPQLRWCETRRGEAVAWDAKLRPWEARAASVVALEAGVRPLAATVRRRGSGAFVLEVENTTGGPLGAGIVIEEGMRTWLSMAEVVQVLPSLSAGERVTVPLPRSTRQGGTPLPPKHVRWDRVLGIPSDFVDWTALRPLPPRDTPLRYAVVTRIPPRFAVEGVRGDVRRCAVRVDPVRVGASVERGWPGFTVEGAGTFGRRQDVRVARVDPTGPAARAGLTPGLRVQFVNGRSVSSASDLQQALGRLLPGERARLVCWDLRTSRQKAFTIVLGRRPADPGR
ncbi:MAG: hypothetical protein D6731_22430 [Planctomycetota bacterium]|nr:MAG: hypothetical protein D6731_22430 [Planctomycetota bacterium]